MVSRYEVHPMEQAFRDWDAKDKIFQRELNIHICRKWDELTTEGKHGHYETLLSVCRSAISFWRNRAETESQASADSIREGIQAKQECANLRATNAELLAALKDALRYVEVQHAYRGAMTAAEVEKAILANSSVAEVRIGANSCNTLAAFDLFKARAAIAKAQAQ